MEAERNKFYTDEGKHIEAEKAAPDVKEERETNPEPGVSASYRGWFSWILLVAGMYFGATGLSGAVLPVSSGEQIDGLVIFTAIIGLIGLIMIAAGCYRILTSGKKV